MKKILILFLLIHIGLSQSVEYYLKDNWYFKKMNDSVFYKANVPGCVHLDLFNNDLIPDPFFRDNERNLQWIENENWQYKTKFDLPESFNELDSIYLCFDGLDTYAKIYLNGEFLLETNNMFIGWEVNCKKYISPRNNELIIDFYSSIKSVLDKYFSLPYKLPAGNDQSDIQVSIFSRKAPYHYGWDWGPRFATSGIWRPIRLVGYKTARIRDIQIIQKELNNSYANIELKINIMSNIDFNGKLEMVSSDNSFESLSQKIILKKGENKFQTNFYINNPILWWTNGLGTPFLYRSTIFLKNNREIVDSFSIKFGLRNLKIVNEKDSIGESFYVLLNNKPIFMKGANYIPSDNFLTRVDSNKYRYLVKSAKDANMNMLRVWGGGIYENDYFYDLCDENGILIFQDFMFACSMYPGDSLFLESIRQEAEYNIKRLRNHPSLALWCGNNEINEAWHNWGWQQAFNYSRKDSIEIWGNYKKIFLDILPNAVNKFDSGRFYWESSPKYGWGNKLSRTNGDMHYWGVWHGEEKFEKFNENIGRFMSEYGFQSFPELSTIKKFTFSYDRHLHSNIMKTHQRHPRGNQLIESYMKKYFQVPEYFDNIVYVSQLLQSEGIKTAIESHRRNMPYCMGTLYWQLNDCWPVASWSSIDYYGNWKALHYFVKKLYKPIVINPYMEDDTLNIYIVSDSLNNIKSTLYLFILNFDGDTLFSFNKDIIIKANNSSVYFSIVKNALLKNLNPKKIFLLAKLMVNDSEIAGNLFYFVRPKDLDLTKATPKITFSQNSDNLEIELSTDKLIKNIFLSMDLFEGHFSDNYFDLLPNENVKITFSSKEKIHNIIDYLSIKSLNDLIKK